MSGKGGGAHKRAVPYCEAILERALVGGNL